MSREDRLSPWRLDAQEPGKVERILTLRHRQIAYIVESSAFSEIIWPMFGDYSRSPVAPSAGTESVRSRVERPLKAGCALHWGGTGEPVLLLAGHGDSRHIFDDFAPGRRDKFHVFALARRGFGASSQPRNGYDLSTMVQGISKVVDALKLERVHLVGHSIAGDEMTRFALTFPNKVGKLIYLEVAYDRVEAQRVEATFPKLASSSGPTSSELRSPEALRTYRHRAFFCLCSMRTSPTRFVSPTFACVQQYRRW